MQQLQKHTSYVIFKQPNNNMQKRESTLLALLKKSQFEILPLLVLTSRKNDSDYCLVGLVPGKSCPGNPAREIPFSGEKDTILHKNLVIRQYKCIISQKWDVFEFLYSKHCHFRHFPGIPGKSREIFGNSRSRNFKISREITSPSVRNSVQKQFAMIEISHLVQLKDLVQLLILMLPWSS